jgi:hypothetical protein
MTLVCLVEEMNDYLNKLITEGYRVVINYDVTFKDVKLYKDGEVVATMSSTHHITDEDLFRYLCGVMEIVDVREIQGVQ